MDVSLQSVFLLMLVIPSTRYQHAGAISLIISILVTCLQNVVEVILAVL